METELRIIERISDQVKLCKWDPKIFSVEWKNEAVICLVPVFPQTKTMVFKSNPLNLNANPDLPVLLNDDPEIILDDTTHRKGGYSSNLTAHDQFQFSIRFKLKPSVLKNLFL